jgi:hypothetical protein
LTSLTLPLTLHSLNPLPFRKVHFEPNEILYHDYDWYVIRNDLSPEVLSTLPVDEKWKSDTTHPDEKYTLFLSKALYKDQGHKFKWSFFPQICLPDETVHFDKVMVSGEVIQHMVMSVLKSAGAVYDDEGHIFD